MFRKEGELSAEEEERMKGFDELWGCHRSPTLQESAAAAGAAGFEVSTRLYPHVGTLRFIGAMFTARGGLNRFGQAFGRSFAPIVFGELQGALE